MLWWISLLLNTIEATRATPAARGAASAAARAEPAAAAPPSEPAPGRAGTGLLLLPGLRGLLASAAIIGGVCFFCVW